MYFNKEEILELAKQSLSNSEKKETGKLNRSLLAAMEDLGLSLHGVGLTDKYEGTIASGTREVTIEGNNNDVRDIWFVKYGTGGLQKEIEYVAPEKFIRDYDDPSADPDVPSKYTILESSNSRPIIKFNCPTSASDKLIVYYFVDSTSVEASSFRSPLALSEGTLAYFFGVDTDRGSIHYANYTRLMMIARSNNDWKARARRKFVMNNRMRSAMTAIKNYMGRRY